MRARAAIAGLALLALAGCELFSSIAPVPVPPNRPSTLQGDDQAEAEGPSPASRALSSYYAAIQNDLLVRGLMRTDGGGPDTPYTDTDLARNFERIAFFDEYVRAGGLRPGGSRPGRLKRWSGPVVMGLEFGDSVSDAVRSRDTAVVQGFASRLGRITGHPIRYTETAGEVNFHVLVLSEDDRVGVADRLREIVPNIAGGTVQVFEDLPRAIHCLVVAFSASPAGYDYTRAIALVRAEHPELLRTSCYHEELAQGLGLANDSPAARPSIFNDDDEFALLTSHDEKLLAMLYDPRLRVGMRAEIARPIVRRLAIEQAGGPT